MTGHVVDPADEGRHAPGEEPLWNESVYADFVAADGSLGGYARLGLYPNLGVAWWMVVVCGPGRDTVTAVDYAAALPLEGFGPFSIGSPLVESSLAWNGPATGRGDPAGIYRDEPGEPVQLGLELTWSTDGSAYHYDFTTRYEIPCNVSGFLTIDGVRVPISGAGQRDHSWGIRDWWSFDWCWAAARLEDGTRLHAADIRIGEGLAFGYLQAAGEVVPLETLTVSEERGEWGLPTSAAMSLNGLDVTVSPLAYGPLVLTATDGRIARFPRCMASFATADGRTGTGWIEWNQAVSS